MECNYSSTSTLIKLVLGILVNGGAILSTLVSFVFLFSNNAFHIGVSLREVLSSYQVANIAGISIVLYDTISTTCNQNNIRWISISVLLTTTHLVILLLVEHSILTSSPRRPVVQRFTGLIGVFWLISTTLGILNSITAHEKHRDVALVAFSIGTMLFVIVLLHKYYVHIKRSEWVRKRLLFFRKKLIKRNHPKNIASRQCWKVKYFVFIFISYVVCAMGWMVEKLYEGVRQQHAPPDVDFCVLLVYSFNFYFPPVVYVQMWQKRTDRKVGALVEHPNNNYTLPKEDNTEITEEQHSVFYTV